MVKTVEMNLYRKLYANYLIVICIMIAASYFLVSRGIYVRWGSFQLLSTISKLMLFSLIGLAVIYGFYLRNQKDKMQGMTDFEKKLSAHRRYFNIRMRWYILSAAVSCVLCLLVANRFFLFFALFELLMLLIVFPNKAFFRKELNDEEIIFL